MFLFIYFYAFNYSKLIQIDIQIKDALGRNWQCATIQLDFQLPQRFNLGYYEFEY